MKFGNGEENLDSDMIRKNLWNRTGNVGRLARLALLGGAMLALLAGRGYAQPVNDFFTNAITIGGSSGTLPANNFFATVEAGEPNHGLLADINFFTGQPFDVPWGSSVWFRWVPTVTGPVVFNTSGGFFFSLDTVLAAYEGTILTNLVQLDTDDQSGGFNASLINFFATAGSEYRIAVAGWAGFQPQGAQGTFFLNWSQTANTNAPPPPLSSNQVQFALAVYETGEAQPGFATIDVQLGSDVTGPVTVDYYTADGSAVAGVDYIGRQGTLTFGFGQTNRSFTIPILDNSFINSNLTVNFFLTNATGAVLGFQSNAVLVILDDETVPFASSAGRFEFTTNAYFGTEFETDPPFLGFDSAVGDEAINAHSVKGVMVTVNRLGGTTGRVLVDYSTSSNFFVITNVFFPFFPFFGGSFAVPGIDYTPVSGTLIFDDFQSSTNFVIPVLSDFFLNGNKLLNVQLSNPRPAPEENPLLIIPTLGTLTNAFVVIKEISATTSSFAFGRANYRLDEYSRANRGTFNIDILYPPGGPTVVDLDLFALTYFFAVSATAGSDTADVFDGTGGNSLLFPNPPFTDGSPDILNPPDVDDSQILAANLNTGLSGGITRVGLGVYRLTFAGGQRRKVVRIPIVNDNLVEFNEDVTIGLFTAPGGPPPNPNHRLASVTILYDDQPAGAADRDWNPDNVFLTTNQPFNLAPGANSAVNSVAVQEDQKTVIVGDFTAFNADVRNGVARINNDGSTDLSFNPGLGVNGTVSDLAIYPSSAGASLAGKIIIVGGFSSYDGQQRQRIARLNVNGTLDASFNPGNGAIGNIRSVVLQEDGKILIAGDFVAFNGVDRAGVARLNADGSLDAAFDPGVGANGIVWSVALLQTAPPLNVSKSTQGGPAEDTEPVDTGARQGTGLISYQFGATPDRLSVVYEGVTIASIGPVTGSGTVPFTFNGQSTLINIKMNEGDTSFGAEWAYTASIQTTGADKKIMIGGEFTEYNGVAINRIARLNPSGSLDLTFNPGGGVDGSIYSVAVQTNNSVLIGGTFSSVDFRTRQSVARLNPDGSLDTTYDVGSGFDDAVYTITIGPDDKAYFGGPFREFNGTRRVGLARLFEYGALDTSFMDTAYNQFAGLVNPFSFQSPNFVKSIALQADGKVMIGGSFTNLGGHAAQEIQNTPFDAPVWTRQDKRTRFNVARLIGGRTPGPGNVEFSFPEYSVSEGAQSLAVTMRRTDGRLGTLTGVVTTTNRTATSGADFVETRPGFATAQMVWEENNGDTNAQPGVTTFYAYPDSIGRVDLRYFRFGITNDTLIEGNEILDLGLANPFGSVTLGGEFIPLGGARSRRLVPVTIIDDDFKRGTIVFSPSAFTVVEGSGDAVVSLIRTNGDHGQVTAVYYTRGSLAQGGTATDNVDFTYVSNRVTFESGQTNAQIRIPIFDDNLTEIDEYFTITLTNAGGGATLPGGLPTSTTSAIITLIDNDLSSGRASFTLASYVTNESAVSAIISVQRLGGSVGSLSVRVAATNGTAANGVNFIGVTNVLTWASGSNDVKLFAVPLRVDGLVAGDKVVNLRLYNAIPASGLGGQSTATLTIQNDDSYGALAFSSSVYDVNENGTNAVITVVRTGGTSGFVSVDYQVNNGTAMNGQDYLSPFTGTLSFAPGVFSRTFEISLLNNDVPDGDRTVDLRLINFVNATNASPIVARLNIIDDESSNVPAGSLDTTFSSLAGANNAVYALALQRDGKIILGGDFRTVNNVTRNRLARLNSNGLLDATFNAGEGPNRPIRAMALQPDGRIIIGGFFDRIFGTNRNHIARLLSDGSVDVFFNPGSGADNPVYSVALTPDGRVVMGGSFTVVDGQPRSGVAMLNTNGTLNTVFNPRVGANGTVYAVAIQSDGKVIIGGDFNQVNNETRPRIARLNVNGSLDTTFNPELGPDGVVRAITLQPDGRILIGGSFTSVNGTNRNFIARLNLDGKLDSGFLTSETGGDGPVLAMALQTDGSIIVAGDFTSFNNVTRNRITRLQANGKTDPTINFGEGANSFIAALLIQPDRKFVIGGGFTRVQGKVRNYLARLYGGSIAGPGSVEFSAPSYNVVENGVQVTIPVRRTGGTTGGVSVDYSTIDVTAISGEDYAPASGTLTFPEGEVLQSFTISIIDDFAVEPDEYVDLLLENPSNGASLGDFPFSSLVILSDDSVVSFVTTTNVVNENVVAGYKEILVVRSGTTNGSVSVDYLTREGTATAGLDYTNVSGTITFVPGETLKSIFVPIINDALVEPTETALVFLTNITSGAQINLGISTLLIVDDDFSPGRLQFSAREYSANEYETNAVITVLRTNGSSGIVKVTYFTIDGDARAPFDYTAVSNQVTFADGETVKTFNVPIIPDILAETNETVTLRLQFPTGGAVLGDPNSVTLTIINNALTNGAFSFAATNVTVSEASVLVNLQVARQFGASGPVTVSYRTVAGTAQAGSDFIAATNVLTWAANDATPKTATIVLINDGIVEATESMGVELFNPTGGAIVGARPSAAITVTDDDVGPGQLAFTSATFSVGENETNAVINVIRTFGMSGTVSIDIATVAGGTAVAGVDYPASSITPTTLTFLNGETNKTFSLPITNNVIVEGNRTVNLELSNPTGGASTNGQIIAAVLTIVEDEQPAGSPDNSFNNAGANLPVNVIAVQTNNNKFFAGGDFTRFNGLDRNHLVRLNLSGSVDTTFDPGTVLGTTNSTVRSLAVQPDGRVLVGGVLNGGANFLTRLAPDGVQDTNFLAGLNAVDNVVDAIALQTDGKIVLGGGFTSASGSPRSRIARLEATGINDPSFNPGQGADADIHAVVAQPDGRIIAAGDFALFNGSVHTRIVRLLPNGSIDPAFDTLLGFDGSVRALALQPGDGKLIVGGYFSSYKGVPRAGVARINSDGSLDSSFDIGTGANDLVTSVALQPDGKIIVGGSFTSFNGVSRNRLVRLNADGSVDYTINIGRGANDYVNSVGIQTDRKIVLGGGFTEFDGLPRNYIARLNGGDNYGSGEFAFSVAAYSVLESGTNGAAYLTITVRRLVGSSNSVTVDFATMDGSAVSPANYQATNGTLSFAPGETVASFDVPLVDDIFTNANRTILLSLSNPVGGARLGSPSSAVITIVNDDAVVGFSVDTYSVSESGVNALITVRREGSTVGGMTVDFATVASSNFTATVGVDYQQASGTLIFSNGQSAATFNVLILDDLLPEGNETLGLALSGVNGSGSAGTLLVDRMSAVLTIVDNEQFPGAISFSTNLFVTGEQVGLAAVTVVRQGGVSGSASVRYTTSALFGPGTATPGSDYLNTNGTLFFGDGQATRTIFVPILDDAIADPDEDIRLTLYDATGAALGLTNAILRIAADQSVFSFATNLFTVDETNGSVTITVVRSMQGTGPVSVGYATVDGGALAGLDYVATNGTLFFATNQFTNTFTVSILDDVLGEGLEIFGVALANVLGEAALATNGLDTAGVAILDNDTSFSFSSTNYVTNESAGTFPVTILRTGNSSNAVSVRFVISDGTATAGQDYAFTNLTVAFAPGEVSRDVRIVIFQDAIGEASETINLTLLNPTNGTSLGIPSTATLTILDDDDTFALSAATYSFSENATNAIIPVQRFGALANAISVQYQTIAGSATPGMDYTNVSGVLTFGFGQNLQFITVPIVNDVALEPSETFSVRLLNASIGSTIISPSNAVVTILEDDANVSFTAPTLSITESGGSAFFPILRAGDTSSIVTVEVISTNGTATAGSDYLGLTNTVLTLTNIVGNVTNITVTNLTGFLVTFQPGETTQFVVVPVLDDMLIEGTETFSLRLINPSTNTVLGAYGTNTATIVDDDASVIIAAGSALISESIPPMNGLIDSNETVTINFGLRNVGNVDTVNLVATLVATNGVTAPSGAQPYGVLVAGGNTVSRAYSFIATGTNGTPIIATFRLQDGANNLGTVTFNFTIGRAIATLANTTGITINDDLPATPYPSSILVSGVIGTVTKVAVRLNNLTHTYPDDIDVLLVGPGGRRVVLMSDAGSSPSSANPVNNVTLTFDETAATAIPDSNQIVTATYRPANHVSGGNVTDFFPGLAQPFTNVSLSIFNGTDPNGTWSLYIVDDSTGGQGNVAGGWSLILTTTDTPVAPADVSVAGSDAPDPVNSGSELIYTLRVTNNGPAAATGVTLSNVLPDRVSYVSHTTTAGSCVNVSSNVTCNLGTLASGGSATVTITATAVTAGTIFDQVTVGSSTPDLNLANNTISVKTSVTPLALLIVPAAGQLELRWRAPAQGYVLQQSSGMATSVWQNVTATPVVVGGTNVLPVSLTNGLRFYRLRAP